MQVHTLVILVLILGSCQETNSIQQDTTGVAGGYKTRHTGVSAYYDTASVISNPGSQSVFALQDAHSYSASDNFIDHGDGTITDVVTGLMWTKNLTPRQTLEEARVSLSQLNAGRYQDWRIPGIKELYSLIDYSGRVFGDRSIRLFINTTYFDQPLGNTTSGELRDRCADVVINRVSVADYGKRQVEVWS